MKWLILSSSSLGIMHNVLKIKQEQLLQKEGSPFLSCFKPLPQSKAKCEAIDMEMKFYTHANKTHFHKKGFALCFVFKVRVLFWNLEMPILGSNSCKIKLNYIFFSFLPSKDLSNSATSSHRSDSSSSCCSSRNLYTTARQRPGTSNTCC